MRKEKMRTSDTSTRNQSLVGNLVSKENISPADNVHDEHVSDESNDQLDVNMDRVAADIPLPPNHW